MATKAAMPSFNKGHTEWHPKIKQKDGLFVVKCGAARLTASTESDLVSTVRTYANAHGWQEIA